MRIGLGGFAHLSLPGLLRLRAETTPSERTAVILVWLPGGPSHLETFDPKPLAPAEYRGPFRSIPTNVPGIEICDLLPRLATIADRYTLLRSMSHNGSNHPSGSLQMLSGDPDTVDKRSPKFPDWMTVASYMRSGRPRDVPIYVGVNPVEKYGSYAIAGPSYLGAQYAPFRVLGDPNSPKFEVPNIGLTDEALTTRLHDRIALRKSLDRLRRDVDSSGLMEAADEFEGQAMRLLVSRETSAAFDLGREPKSVRNRYGRHQWGQQCLLARRLVEAGVEIVTTEFSGKLGGMQYWDDHAVNCHVFDAMKHRAPFLDQAVSALIEDLYERGLDRRVLVVVAGEFGRTPRISYAASRAEKSISRPKGTMQPGRDHWPRASSILFAGGGIRTGQIVGATDRRGEDPIERRVGPEDFLATIYRHLGFEFEGVTLPDSLGRPIPLIRDGRVIEELCG